MAFQNDIAAIRTCIANQIDPVAIGDRRIAGVIGDAPSLIRVTAGPVPST